MELKTYSEIIKTIRKHTGLTRDCMKLLSATFPEIDNDTLSSILSINFQRQMKHMYTKSDAMITKYNEAYKIALQTGEQEGIIIRLAVQSGIAPCLLAKLILIRYCESLNYEENIGDLVNKYVRNSCLIQDARLAQEILMCTMYDDQYSPSVECIKNSVGREYEIKLHRQLSELDIAYRDEEYMRKLGYDKTPDVKLEIPIAVEGFVIHWIESKALFGDVDSHKDYVRNQYSSYWNRFGPGLVIYWFGFVDIVSSSVDKRFIVRNHLPFNIVKI